MKHVSFHLPAKSKSPQKHLPTGCPIWHAPACMHRVRCKPKKSTKPQESLLDRYKKALWKSFKNKGELLAVESLIHHGCDVNTRLENGETALLAATFWKNTRFMTTLIDQYQADIEAVRVKIQADKPLKTFFNLFLHNRELSSKLQDAQRALCQSQKDVESLQTKLKDVEEHELHEVRTIETSLLDVVDTKTLRTLLSRAIRQTEIQHKQLREKDDMLRLLENPTKRRRRAALA